MGERSLYERLGGIYAIAAVVDRFSDQLLKNPKIVNANPQLKEWHTQKYKTRLPGLKFGRTLWVASVAGGPYHLTATLTATLKPGTVELYCSVPGHKAAGMDVKIKVS